MTYLPSFKLSGKPGLVHVVYSSVSGVGWVMTPAADDTKFDAGSKITQFHGWQDYGAEYADMTCFTSATQINTPRGARPVADLRPGDLVLTVDNGAQPVLWAGVSKIEMTAQILHPKTRPVVIPANSFGPGIPARDLSVSAPHRIVLSPKHLALYHGVAQAFAPASALLGLHNIHRAAPQPNLAYHHIMLPRHEVVVSNNLESESFFPGGHALKALAPLARRDLFQAFPELAADPASYGQTAQLCLTKRETRLLQMQEYYAIA